MKIRIRNKSNTNGIKYWILETYRWWFPIWLVHSHYIFSDFKTAELVAKRICNPKIMDIK